MLSVSLLHWSVGDQKLRRAALVLWLPTTYRPVKQRDSILYLYWYKKLTFDLSGLTAAASTERACPLHWWSSFTAESAGENLQIRTFWSWDALKNKHPSAESSGCDCM